MGTLAASSLAAGAAGGGTALAGASTAAALAAGASAGVGAFSSLRQGQAQAAQAETQRKLQERNQKIAQQRAEDRREAGRIQAQRRRRQADLKIGTQKSTLAGRGVRIDTGTPQDVFEGTAEFGELDALTLRNNAERDALRFEQQGTQAGIQADLFDAKADSARTQGKIGAAKSVVSGAQRGFQANSLFSQQDPVGGGGGGRPGPGRQSPPTPRQTGGSIFDTL